MDAPLAQKPLLILSLTIPHFNNRCTILMQGREGSLCLKISLPLFPLLLLFATKSVEFIHEKFREDIFNYQLLSFYRPCIFSVPKHSQNY